MGTALEASLLRFVPLLLSAAAIAGCATDESRTWRDAREQNIVAAYEQFLALYPDGALADSARYRIEAVHFDNAVSDGTVAAYEQYLVLYPDGALADSARYRIEAVHFDSAVSEGTVAAYEQYQAQFAEGVFGDSVRRILDSMMPLEPQLTEYTVHRSDWETCDVEFTVFVAHRSGTFGPTTVEGVTLLLSYVSGLPSGLLRAEGGTGTSVVQIREIVNQNPNHSTVQATGSWDMPTVFSIRDGPRPAYCTGVITARLTLADRGSNVFDRLDMRVDFGEGGR